MIIITAATDYTLQATRCWNFEVFKSEIFLHAEHVESTRRFCGSSNDHMSDIFHCHIVQFKKAGDQTGEILTYFNKFLDLMYGNWNIYLLYKSWSTVKKVNSVNRWKEQFPDFQFCYREDP